jgi:low affinity Fe/Cu permease
MTQRFSVLAARVALAAGSYRTFLLAVALILAWAVSGPVFGFSEPWQLVVNTSTTIVTFLMVFLIQNTQNRDSLAVHLKLDELIRAVADADDAVMDAEDRTDDELAELKAKYAALCAEHEALERRVGVGASPGA